MLYFVSIELKTAWIEEPVNKYCVSIICFIMILHNIGIIIQNNPQNTHTFITIVSLFVINIKSNETNLQRDWNISVIKENPGRLPTTIWLRRSVLSAQFSGSRRAPTSGAPASPASMRCLLRCSPTCSNLSRRPLWITPISRSYSLFCEAVIYSNSLQITC